ncbi:MAG: sel1 repeat family protein [Alphaproteobacteria bacterium]|nr:MAG: sel1 repeat family protein [Alphaproteobacteria bacterium]
MRFTLFAAVSLVLGILFAQGTRAETNIVTGCGVDGCGEPSPYQEARAAYENGDYAEAAKNLKRLEAWAKAGHKGAQELLGIMYRYGHGVPKDSKKAFAFLLQAAEAKKPLAEYHLAAMYYSGEGVQPNPSIALMWVHIALVHFDEGPEKQQAAQSRDDMYAHTKRREKDRACQMAVEWLIKKGEGGLAETLCR